MDTQQVMWIAPGKEIIENHGPCPYVNLPGVRQPQLIEKDKVLTLYLPDGSNSNPFSE